MSRVNSLLPEGKNINEMLATITFESASVVDLSGLEGCPVHICNKLFKQVREGLSGLTLLDPKVLPSLISLGGPLYCLGEGEWANRCAYSCAYFKQVLLDCYPEVINNTQFGKLVLKLNTAMRFPSKYEGILDICLSNIFGEFQDVSLIGDRLRGLSFFALALLVAANISCHSLSLLGIVNHFGT